MTLSHQVNEPFRLSGRKVWVVGHRGMVGSAICRRLQSADCEIISCERSEVDLRRQKETENWIADQKPEVVFHAAGTVGGIHANESRPAEFLYDNLVIESNVIEAAHRFGVEKLLFLGSSCIYPRMATQPMAEEALLSGPLEPTNQWYAIAKIAGIKLCQAYRKQYGLDFISAMPSNLYGLGDNFDPKTGHVIPMLLRRFHEAKRQGDTSVTIWGTGTPRREFLYVDDCADALVHLMKHYSGMEHVNVGMGSDLTILELAETVTRVVEFQGVITLDPSKPDGTPQKLLDVRRLNSLGWQASTGLAEGLQKTYAWFLEHFDDSQ